ncbi:MAG: hypothetical protein ACJ8AI_06405 [Rhodopila sp.]
MIIVFVNFVRTFLFGLFLAAAGGFLTWHSVQMHYAGVVVFMHVLLARIMHGPRKMDEKPIYSMR